MSDEREQAPSEEWQAGWESHRQRQILSFALGTTPEQRLEWLEEMIALAHQTGALPRRKPD